MLGCAKAQTHLGVQHILIIVDDDIAEGQHVAGQEVRTPALLAPKDPHVVQGVDARVKDSVLPSALQLLKEAADLNVGFADVLLPNPGCCQLPALGVHTLSASLLCSQALPLESWASIEMRNESLLQKALLCQPTDMPRQLLERCDFSSPGGLIAARF